MLEKDTAAQQIKAAVDQAKRDVQLQAENQKQPESGHSDKGGEK